VRYMSCVENQSLSVALWQDQWAKLSRLSYLYIKTKVKDSSIEKYFYFLSDRWRRIYLLPYCVNGNLITSKTYETYHTVITLSKSQSTNSVLKMLYNVFFFFNIFHKIEIQLIPTYIIFMSFMEFKLMSHSRVERQIYFHLY
jgi:hypothetical protein